MISAYVLEQGIESGRGHVHSVFATSFNVELDGFLFHVGGSHGPLSCCGANVAPDVLHTLLDGCSVGDLAIVKHGVLRVYDVAGTRELDLGAFEVRSLSIASPVAFGQLATLEGAIEELGLEELIGLERSAQFEQVVDVLEQRDPDKGDLREAIGFLLGRGLGLTPSGDDMLVGYGIARWLIGRPEPYVRILQDMLARQTTDVSVAYLRAMMAGHANQGYCELVEATRTGAFDRFPGLLADLQQVGHTSGNDGLFGFAAGLRGMVRAS